MQKIKSIEIFQLPMSKKEKGYEWPMKILDGSFFT